MPIPELERQAAEVKLRAYCETKIPASLREQVQLDFEVKGMSIILYESRPHYSEPDLWTKSPVAKFTFKKKDRLWYLLWMDRNEKWHHFDPPSAAKKMSDLIDEIERDKTALFWG